jgi:hypothetical protein
MDTQYQSDNLSVELFHFFASSLVDRAAGGMKGMDGRKVDDGLCGRFSIAVAACFADESGIFRQTVAAKRLGTKSCVISDIKRRIMEPSKALISRLLNICEYIDASWLITGKLNAEYCDRIKHVIMCLNLNDSKVLFATGVSHRFLHSIFNHELSPSYVFINRFFSSFNAVDKYGQEKRESMIKSNRILAIQTMAQLIDMLCNGACVIKSSKENTSDPDGYKFNIEIRSISKCSELNCQFCCYNLGRNTFDYCNHKNNEGFELSSKF